MGSARRRASPSVATTADINAAGEGSSAADERRVVVATSAAVKRRSKTSVAAEGRVEVDGATGAGTGVMTGTAAASSPSR